MIRLEGLKKKFGSREILRGLDLHIERGHTVCIIGGSGTGKSVTLKHIMRLLEPDEGRIIFDGEDITFARGKKLSEARRKMGVLFQSGALLNWLTVGQNVALPLEENTTMSRKEIDARVTETLELLQIPHARDLYPNQISGGMQKRAGLARAVIWRPPCILYDEPTSGLDPVITALVDEMIIEMRDKLGATQVIITHDMTSAYRTADKICMLYQGQVEQYGTPDEIRATTSPIVRQFIEGLATGPITAGMKRIGDDEKKGEQHDEKPDKKDGARATGTRAAGTRAARALEPRPKAAPAPRPPEEKSNQPRREISADVKSEVDALVAASQIDSTSEERPRKGGTASAYVIMGSDEDGAHPIDESGVDESGLDESGLDESGLDDSGSFTDSELGSGSAVTEESARDSSEGSREAS